MPEVTNYLMKPSYFGMIPKLPYVLPDGTNVAAGNPFGLEPFYNDDGSIKFPNDPWTQSTQGYPLPWKNLCPFCRGVGMWPQFKIRDINPDLFAGHNLKVNQTSARGEVPMDPDQTATGPETWEQANMRIALHEDAMFQVETAVTNAKYVLPQYQYRNLPYTDPPGTAAGPSSALANLAFTAVTNINGTQVTQPVKRWPFPHPLTFNTLRKLMPGATAGQKTLAQQKGWDKIVPDSWKCYVPTTTVQMGSPVEAQLDHKMGRVIFSEALFIPCYKDFSAIQVLGADQKAKLLNNGLLSTATPARGFRTADERGLPTGYWRPARVWLTFCYNRERYFHDGVAKPDGTAIGSIQFNYTNADGIQGQYEARALILDGRYAMEVRKVNPENNSQNVELGFANRTIQAIHEDSNDWTRIEVFEDDYWKMPCPPQPESTQAFTAYVAAKTTTYHNLFPQGMILKWERTTPGEALVEAAGWTDADHFGSFMRPKLFTWYLRDQRPRLLELAVRRLEIVNDVQVSGTLEIVGPVPQTTTGLGWVDYPDRGRAAVKRLTYNFEDGYVNELELHREETRLGEVPPAERDRQNRVVKSLTALSRTTAAQAAASARQAKTPKEKPIEVSTIHFITGGA
jgi:hypothetical protein